MLKKGPSGKKVIRVDSKVSMFSFKMDSSTGRGKAKFKTDNKSNKHNEKA